MPTADEFRAALNGWFYEALKILNPVDYYFSRQSAVFGTITFY